MVELRRADEEADRGGLAFGVWGQRWIGADLSLQHLDAQLLMWDMRRNLDPSPLPKRRSVIQFQYADASPPHRQWRLIVDPQGEVICA